MHDAILALLKRVWDTPGWVNNRCAIIYHGDVVGPKVAKALKQLG